jgi:hypothetical protein|tara:strand:+ start:15292 stop:15663 length:372 start_codon:yes stop_codon:yes gene_type:complete
MALVNKVDKRIKVTVNDAIEYQIMTHCFFNNIQISNSDLKCLTQLAKDGETELTLFCKNIAVVDIFKSPQSARNAITKAAKKNLITKKGKNKKTICISKELNIQTDGTILLDFKILGYEPQKA